MDLHWVHCNLCCAIPPSNVRETFFITSCGHIACSQCLNKRGPANCCVCAKDCKKIALKQPLPSQVEFCVTDPLPSLTRLKEVFKFQTSQFDSLMDLQLQQYKERYQALLNKKQALESRKKQLQEEISKIEERNRNQARLSRLSLVPTPPLFGLGRDRQPMLSGSTRFNRQIVLQTPTSLGINKYSHQQDHRE